MYSQGILVVLRVLKSEMVYGGVEVGNLKALGAAENPIVKVGNWRTTKPSTMRKGTGKSVIRLSGADFGLEDLIRQGVRQVIQQAIEAELEELLERFMSVKTLHGQFVGECRESVEDAVGRRACRAEPA